ncbi:MAG: hypothetical protein MUC62_08745 [Candidatus Thermoplasmatota archaeon]|jgi:hypothetical protein|nr:hypothetical protein [Candidatus Thermoplasmatota archaeon]
MPPEKSSIMVVILSKDSEVQIVSTLQLLRFYLATKVGIDPKLTVIDNCSGDRTIELVRSLRIRILEHLDPEPWSAIVKEALTLGKEEGVRTLVILDLKGGNDAEDAISLISRSIKEEDLFASAYILPVSNTRGIGCWALDRGLLTKMDGDFGYDVEKKMMDLSSRGELEVENVSERFRLNSKKVRRNFIRSFWKYPTKTITYFFRSHPLTVFGGLGLFVLLVATGTGIYTIDYFYQYNTLNYFPAILTMALIMIGGFFMVAGLMLNALNVLVERVEAIKKWVS